jgi:uncharacterized cupin superfamily protein
MATENLIEFGTASAVLNPLPIRPSWVLEGSPATRVAVLSSSSDRTAKCIIWDCTAGRFNWIYDQDETIYLIEGSVIIKDPSGREQHLTAGETIFFRAGSRAEWIVEKYVRKFAVIRAPVPKYALLAIRAVRVFRKVTGLSRTDVPSAFG